MRGRSNLLQLQILLQKFWRRRNERKTQANVFTGQRNKLGIIYSIIQYIYVDSVLICDGHENNARKWTATTVVTQLK